MCSNGWEIQIETNIFFGGKHSYFKYLCRRQTFWLKISVSETNIFFGAKYCCFKYLCRRQISFLRQKPLLGANICTRGKYDLLLEDPRGQGGIFIANMIFGCKYLKLWNWGKILIFEGQILVCRCPYLLRLSPANNGESACAEALRMKFLDAWPTLLVETCRRTRGGRYIYKVQICMIF